MGQRRANAGHSSTENDKRKNKPIESRKIASNRWKPNARERTRLSAMRNAFDRLQQHIPLDPAERQPTQSQIMRRAIDYIRYLRAFVGEDGSCELDSESKVPTSTEKSSLSRESSSIVISQTSRENVLPRFFTEKTTRCVQPHRVAINVITRKRSRQIRLAFDALRSCVPVHPSELCLNKATLLRRATEYIAFMRELLGTALDQAGDNLPTPRRSSPETLDRSLTIATSTREKSPEDLKPSASCQQ